MSPDRCRGISILGSTGSIGEQALDVVRLHPERLRVRALAGGRRVERLRLQALEFRPATVCVAEESDALALQRELGPGFEVVHGPVGLVHCASLADADVVLNALVGAVGLRPSLAGLLSGKTVALANKETLVTGGPLVEAAAVRGGGRLIPVDSEHWALAELLEGRNPAEARQIWLTASGGPLRTLDPAEWGSLKAERVLQHPVWNMGPRITVDSATLLNKGFEVLEAQWLFGLSLDRVGAVVHPETLVHAMVEWGDGSWTAHLSAPSMSLPIQKALLGERTLPTAAPPLGLLDLGRLTFQAIDGQKFPCYALARRAGEAGGTVPAALNAADEVAVEAFLDGRIGFLDIGRVLNEVVERHDRKTLRDPEDVWEADREARRVARSIL